MSGLFQEYDGRVGSIIWLIMGKSRGMRMSVLFFCSKYSVCCRGVSLRLVYVEQAVSQ